MLASATSVIIFGPIFAFTMGILDLRKYQGVWSMTIWGSPDFFTGSRFLSIISMLTVCAIAFSCA